MLPGAKRHDRIGGGDRADDLFVSHNDAGAKAWKAEFGEA